MTFPFYCQFCWLNHHFPCGFSIVRHSAGLPCGVLGKCAEFSPGFRNRPIKAGARDQRARCVALGKNGAGPALKLLCHCVLHIIQV